MHLIFLFTALITWAHALPHGKSAFISRDHEEGLAMEHDLLPRDDSNCANGSSTTRELATGGLFGGPPIQWHPSISPTASDAIDSSFTNGFAETVKEGMKNAARAAQAKGIQTRWWGIGQSWAWGTAYSLQKELGADWLHADNLDDAVAFEQDRLRSLSTECLPEIGNQ